MAFQFWQKVERTDQFHLNVQRAARAGHGEFLALLEDTTVRRGFWRYILDKDNFSKWPNESKKALIQKAWFDGFMTLTHYPQAMALTLAATSFSLFAMSLFTGATVTIFTCLITTALICAASFFMDDSDELGSDNEQSAQFGNN